MSQLQFASRHLVENLVCSVIVLLGLTVTGGWLLHVPAMVEIKHGLLPMVFNTGLCFLVAGLILLTIRRTGGPAAMGRNLFAGVLVLLCTTTLVEIWLDRHLGVDLAFLHAWYDYGNTRPGRMAPNTAIGFILIGMAIMLSNRVKSRWQALALIGLTFCILAIGLTGLVGYYLAPDLLFGWAKSARMAVHTATGMILCGVALWLHWCGSKWYLAAHFIRQDEKIRFLGGAILIIVTITAGLGGFVLQQRSLQNILESELTSTRSERTSLFHAAIADVEGDAHTAIRLLGFDKVSQSVLDGTASPRTLEIFEQQGAQLVNLGFRGALLEDQFGRPVRIFGRLHQSPELIAKANTSNSADLVWDMGLVVRIKLPLHLDNGEMGVLTIDKQVPSLKRSLFDNSIIGKTGEVAICSNIGNYLHCFPGTRHSAPFLIPLRYKTGTPLPMEIALAGNTGIRHAIDYRNQNVIAAYSPLAPKLGIVVKQDTAELYGVIRQALSYGLPLITALCLLGAALLYLQLKPLTSRLIQSEKNASDKEQELRTIMHAVSDGLLTLNSNGQIKSANPAAHNLFRHPPHTLVNQRISALLTADLQKAHSHEMAQLMENRLHPLVDNPNLEMIGLGNDGSEFPIEISVAQVEVSNQTLYVLTVRDITQRKEVQSQLAALAHYDFLTGLPNRSLFMDRLSTAKLRVKRNNTSIALMFMDLDGFKQINDTFGHQGGDDLLVQFATRIRAAVRATDTVGRLSGDEFTVLLEGLDNEENANQVAQKIIHAMQIPFDIKGQAVRVTTSLGMVMHHPYSPDLDVKELLNRADAAMYVAKNTGKNSISIA